MVQCHPCIHEAANFGRYILMHETEWREYWHKQWRRDPQIIEDMYDAHLMKEWESKFKK